MANGNEENRPDPDDLVQSMGFEINPDDYSLEQIEKAVRAGYQIEKDADMGKARVVSRTVVKGNKNKDPRDVSE